MRGRLPQCLSYAEYLTISHFSWVQMLITVSDARLTVMADNLAQPKMLAMRVLVKSPPPSQAAVEAAIHFFLTYVPCL